MSQRPRAPQRVTAGHVQTLSNNFFQLCVFTQLCKALYINRAEQNGQTRDSGTYLMYFRCTLQCTSKDALP